MLTRTLLNNSKRLAVFNQTASIANRQFTKSSIAQDNKKLDELDEKLQALQRESSYNLNDNSLLLRPDLWKGLPDKKIMELYKKRVSFLGKDYKRSKVELDALLSTTQDPYQASVVETMYYETEADQFAADEETNWDDFFTEGEFMDDADEPHEYDEYPTAAQDIVRDFRDQMKFNRIAAYELPFLTQYRQEYIPPAPTEKPVTYRYTSYLGDVHPADRKVVVSLKVADLNLSSVESHKFKLLAGVRYDNTTDVFKMSSEKFLEPAQNASFLSDILDELITESKKEPEYFSDVPLDTRHTTAKYSKKSRRNLKTYKFPDSWKKPIDKMDRTVDLAGELLIPSFGRNLKNKN
ncbi:hypothetical protein CANARDRAFT_7205 [[Candida] arabinofermentans NRRL YB-2248]|uniref:Small ribosomal subunit protein mS35 n=1 Tax=[Candida] arabinofermentans NRRL YB-2248 TaxID=983967 RepID=A0A1E4T297_9ASCO|nr:hypothetical protein CANARDRAFT_7205 [[Candida] arabinofermentans NRRL YB-2248]